MLFEARSGAAPSNSSVSVALVPVLSSARTSPSEWVKHMIPSLNPSALPLSTPSSLSALALEHLLRCIVAARAFQELGWMASGCNVSVPRRCSKRSCSRAILLPDLDTSSWTHVWVQSLSWL